ncbi:hypothetical protein PoB_006391500 [Plakobranchus ocellatus]|uniref:Uncharacterized protein n=1 Tax=Plakobranchus ocellatus TaxID=259542 RepID=A0AAV4D039_9GAST|nr:hypothetical protein PoB_006391500 [Plakobranchus ocellatus]
MAKLPQHVLQGPMKSFNDSVCFRMKQGREYMLDASKDVEPFSTPEMNCGLLSDCTSSEKPNLVKQHQYCCNAFKWQCLSVASGHIDEGQYVLKAIA